MATLKQNICYTIRPMQDGDISQSIELDREAFPTQWPHPTYTSFKQELRNRLAYYLVASKQNNVQAPSLESKEDSKGFWEKMKHLFNPDQPPYSSLPSNEYIIGMAGFWLMMNEAHVTTIAVREAYRRLGVGERLLISLVDLSIQRNAHIVTLEVRASNELAQVLYQKYGFYKTGIRHRYYTDNSEDAFIMSTDTLSSPSFQSNYQKLKKAYEAKWNCSLLGQW